MSHATCWTYVPSICIEKTSDHSKSPMWQCGHQPGFQPRNRPCLCDCILTVTLAGCCCCIAHWVLCLSKCVMQCGAFRRRAAVSCNTAAYVSDAYTACSLGNRTDPRYRSLWKLFFFMTKRTIVKHEGGACCCDFATAGKVDGAVIESHEGA